MTVDLPGRAAIVTGGAKGIGRAMVAALVRLASDAARSITGVTLAIDGGVTIAAP